MQISHISMRKILMPCPQCTDDYNFTSQSWVHGGCGGVLFIDENSIVHCKACGKQAHITQMHMSCSKHLYFKATKKQLLTSLAMSKMCRVDKSLSWLIKILREI